MNDLYLSSIFKLSIQNLALLTSGVQNGEELLDDDLI
jgi:hypothetical protein